MLSGPCSSLQQVTWVCATPRAPRTKPFSFSQIPLKPGAVQNVKASTNGANSQVRRFLSGSLCDVNYELSFDNKEDADATEKKIKKPNGLMQLSGVFAASFKAEMEEKKVDSTVSSSISGAAPAESTKREERSNSSNEKNEKNKADDSASIMARAIEKYEAERGINTFGGGFAVGMCVCLFFIGAIAFAVFMWKRQKNTNESPLPSSTTSTNSKRAGNANNVEMVGVTVHESKTLNNPAFGQRRRSTGEKKTTDYDKKKPHRRASTQLPKGWQKHSDGTGRRYYANKLTSESSWTAPPGSTGGNSSEIEMMVNPSLNAKKQRRLSSRELMQAEKEKETEAEEEQYTCEHCDTFTGNLSVVESHEAVCEYNADAATMETEASDENIEVHLDEETGRRYSINHTTGESEWVDE